MNTLTKYWFLEGFNLFKKLGRPTMMRLCRILEMENIDKGMAIRQNNPGDGSLFFLKQGTVKIVDNANNTVKYIVKRGNIFGELALYDSDASSKETAYALEDGVICHISSHQMKEIMEEHRSLKNGLLKIYGLRIRKLERRLQDLLYKDSGTRIEEFVNDYVREFGEESDGEWVVKNLLSHSDIANLTNTSRQTVSNTLSTLRKKGRIQYNSESISIPERNSISDSV